MQCSIVNYSNLDTYTFRLDAEYYKPLFLYEDKKLSKFTQKYLGDIAFITDGQHGYHEVDATSIIAHLTAKNAKNWFADKIGADPLAKWVDDKNKRSSLKKNDLILSTRGTVGFCALVKDNVLPANIDQDVARIFIKDRNYITPETLLAYINSEFGQDWIKRNVSGMVQQGISLEKLRLMPLPKFNRTYMTTISKIIDASFKYKSLSLDHYSLSQNLLLSELGLENWKPKHRLTFFKNYSDTFNVKRIDAEYFQPKYDEIIKAIKKYLGGYGKLSKIVNVKDNNYCPSNNTNYKYIELADIGNNGEIKGYTEEVGANLPTRARRIVNTNDLIISSIEGSLDKIALIEKSQDKSLCSTGFYVLNSDIINSETLLIFFKSVVGQLQLKRGCRGTILTAINKNDLSNIVVPLIRDIVQNSIGSFVQESFEMRNKSKSLLDIAKKGVELAIEQDEKSAERWIEDNVNKLGVNLSDA